jgi:S1-C subfamily serine protease
MSLRHWTAGSLLCIAITGAYTQPPPTISATVFEGRAADGGSSLPSPLIAGQKLSVLRIRIVLVDGDGTQVPVPRHALLISDNPASDVPRRVQTSVDGTVDVRLLPGNYTVESDKPVAFQGKSYHWVKTLDIAAGRETVLELTIGNAEVEIATAAASGSAPGPGTDPSISLPRWFDSVVVIWTPHIRASGFLVDAAGLIVTSRRIVGIDTEVEVQLTPSVKVPARVIESDPARDVAVIRIDPQVVASLPPVPLGCAASRPSVVDGQEIWALGAPLRGPKRVTSGMVSRVEPNAMMSDVRLSNGSPGGPVFAADGTVIGLTTLTTDDERDLGRSRAVRIGAACEVMALAAKKMNETIPPATHLPVEPIGPFPAEALKSAAKNYKGAAVAPYQVSSSDFDVAFITPALAYIARSREEESIGRTNSAMLAGTQSPIRTLLDFGAWADYVEEFPPVLLVRATPRFAEGFWTMVARGAARTQGVSLPPIKRFKSGFARMTAMCGDSEVVPIHPFKIEQRISETDSITEGLYVFDPGALGPQCGTVTLVLYSEKDPAKADRRIVDATVLERLWKDFAPYRKE